MAKKISELTSASALDGTELLPIVQGGVTKQITADSLIGKTVYSGDVTFHVSTTGNNSNDGLTTGTAFATMQYAFDHIRDNVMMTNNGKVTIQLANGTYTSESAGGVTYHGCVGATEVHLLGDETTPNNVISNNRINTTRNSVSSSKLLISGVRFKATQLNAINCASPKNIVLVHHCEFENTNGVCILAYYMSHVTRTISKRRIPGKFSIISRTTWHETTRASL